MPKRNPYMSLHRQKTKDYIMYAYICIYTQTYMYMCIYTCTQKATTSAAKIIPNKFKIWYYKSQKLTIIMYDLFILTIQGYKSNPSHPSTL